MIKVITILSIWILSSFTIIKGQNVSQYIDAANEASESKKEELLKEGLNKLPNNKELLLMLTEYYYYKKDYANSKEFLERLLRHSNEFEKEIISKRFEKIDDKLEAYRAFNQIMNNLGKVDTELLKLIKKFKTEYPEYTDYIKELEDLEYKIYFDQIINNLHQSDTKILEFIEDFRSKPKSSNYGVFMNNLNNLEYEICYQNTTILSRKYEIIKKHYGDGIKYDIEKDWLNNHQCSKCGGDGKIYSHTTTHKITCSSCNGSGRCSRCGGDGMIPCYYHDTDQDGYCTYCNNRGTVDCYECNATGICPSCSGAGYHINRKSHYKTCSKCNGRGSY